MVLTKPFLYAPIDLQVGRDFLQVVKEVSKVDAADVAVGEVWIEDIQRVQKHTSCVRTPPKTETAQSLLAPGNGSPRAPPKGIAIGTEIQRALTNDVLRRSSTYLD
jgi:hypothetical protein